MATPRDSSEGLSLSNASIASQSRAGGLATLFIELVEAGRVREIVDPSEDHRLYWQGATFCSGISVTAGLALGQELSHPRVIEFALVIGAVGTFVFTILARRERRRLGSATRRLQENTIRLPAALNLSAPDAGTTLSYSGPTTHSTETSGDLLGESVSGDDPQVEAG